MSEPTKDLTQEMLNEIGDQVKDKVPDLKADLSEWGKILAEITLRKSLGDSDKLPELLKTEKYFWSAMEQKKAQYTKKIEDFSWSLIERLLVLIRKIVLS